MTAKTGTIKNLENVTTNNIETEEGKTMFKVCKLSEFRPEMLDGRNVVSVGKDEKRRNDEIIEVNLSYSKAMYCLFYKGDNDILKKVLEALEGLEKDPKHSMKYYEILISCLHVVHHVDTEKSHSKLDGINSLSTSCLDNSFCIARMKSGISVCVHCYAANQQKMQLGLQDRNIINGIILRNVIIPVKAWKKYFKQYHLSKYFRIESFGDIQNVTQGINYVNFMKAFPRIHFAVWSKNLFTWKKVFETETVGKPENCVYIHSSNQVNCVEAAVLENMWFVDHVFTVFDKKFTKKNDIKITCGGLACKKCIAKKEKCYFKDDNKIVNEQLK